MNRYLQLAQQYWLDRTDQERRLMTIAAPLLFLGILYWGIWQPVQQSLEMARNQVAAESAALAQVKQNANRYVASGGKVNSSGVQGSLSQVASRSAQGNRLSIERMQPQGDKLQLWVEDAEFDNLMSWLSELSSQGVVISAFDISAAEEAGKVQIRRLQLSK